MNLGRICGIFVLALLLAACGGGGGGSSGGDGGGGQTGGSGAFSLNQSALSYSLRPDTSASQLIRINVGGSKVAYVGAAFDDGQPTVPWLDFWIDGNGSQYYLEVVANTYGMSLGTHTASFTVGSADENGEVLQKKVVTVTLTVTDNFVFWQPSVSVSVAQGKLPEYPIELSFYGGASATWTATSDATWLTLTNPTGVGSGQLLTALDTTNLSPGSYSALITLSENGNSTNSTSINYLLTVIEPIEFESLSSEFTYVAGLAPESESFSLNFTAGSNTVLVPTSNAYWLSLSVNEATGSLDATFDPNQLPYGSTTEIIYLRDNDNWSNVSEHVVTVNVLPPIRFEEAAQNVLGAIQSTPLVYGSDLNQISFELPFYAGDTTQWSAQATESWVQVSSSTGTGPGSLVGAVNMNGITPGTYNAELTLSDIDVSANAQTLNVVARVIAPYITATGNSLLLGGADGLGSPTGELGFSINTGANSYPYTLNITTDDEQNWLSASAMTGELSSTRTPIVLNADADSLPSGTHRATVTVTVQVNDLELTHETRVTFNKEANRLVMSSVGVALTSSPTLSVLTRDLTVLSSIDRTDVEWVAESNQSWLSVTESGTTGGELTLSADANGLAAGATYFATVTVSSPDEQVENQETIRVGLTVLAEDPIDTHLNLETTYDYSSFLVGGVLYGIVASPVEPLVFVNLDNQIKAYNVFTGVVERTFDIVIASAASMAISQDGETLYVYDTTNYQIVELNATSGEVTHRYAANYTGWGYALPMPGYMRPDGRPILVGAGDYIYDLETREQIASDQTPRPHAYSLSTNQTPNWVVASDGTLYGYQYSALGGGIGTLTGEWVLSSGNVQGREGQACINAQSTRVYTASGAPYEFPAFGIVSQIQEQTLPGTNYPNAIVCGWNGVVVGGADAYYGEVDIFVYDSETGISLGNHSSSTQTSYRALLHRGLALSGDNQRVIALSSNSGFDAPAYVQLRFITIPVLD